MRIGHCDFYDVTSDTCRDCVNKNSILVPNTESAKEGLRVLTQVYFRAVLGGCPLFLDTNCSKTEEYIKCKSCLCILNKYQYHCEVLIIF